MRPEKITLGEMRSSGVRGLLIYCADYKCTPSVAISGDRWPDHVRLSAIRQATRRPRREERSATQRHTVLPVHGEIGRFEEITEKAGEAVARHVGDQLEQIFKDSGFSVILFAGAAHANCVEAWPPDMKTRPDFTCVPLTDRLLVSLQGATKAEVIKAMKANGRPVDNNKVGKISEVEFH